MKWPRSSSPRSIGLRKPGRKTCCYPPLPAAKVGADDVKIEAKVIVAKSPEREEVELCLLHQKPIEVVCMNDYERLCSKCALFGEHKNHDFKGVEGDRELKQEMLPGGDQGFRG